VLVGILLNQNGVNRLDARITALEARVNALSKQLHDDIVMLVGRDMDKAERLARLEERSKS
jgi:division protein CdvB (Snf7/Vps24/ESCRT-III family)